MPSPVFHNPEIPSPELLSLEEFCELQSGIGNHEAKLAVFLLMASQPDRQFTTGSLSSAVREAQPEDRGWHDFSDVLLTNYCRESLEPVGGVVKGQVIVRGKAATAFRVSGSDLGIEWGVPLGGALAEWSLDNPDLALGHVFGRTNSISNNRAPFTRYQLLFDLVTQDSARVGIAQLEGFGSLKDTNIEVAMNDLARNGVVSIDSIHTEDDRQITIEDPGYNGSLPFEKLHPSTQVIYNTMRHCADHKLTGLTVDEFVEIAAKVAPDYSDLPNVRRRLTMALSPSQNVKWLKGIVNEDGPHNDARHYTVVSLSPKWEQAVHDLVAKIDAIHSGEQTAIARGRQVARAVVDDHHLFATLMAKGRQFSANANERSLDTWGHLVKNALGEESLTAHELRSRVSTPELPVSIRNMDRVLGELAQRSLITIVETPVKDSKKRPVKHYSLAKTEQQDNSE
jgi:hypothetical protein